MIILRQQHAGNNPSLLFSACGPCVGDGSRLWHDMIRTLDLLPAPEAFGTVQSIAGARAEGHPACVTSRSHRLSPVPWGRPWVYVLSGSLCKGDNMLFNYISNLSVAGARAEGHPVHVTSRSHCLSPAPWYMTMGMQEKVSGQEDGWTLCKYRAIALAKRPSGPLTEWSSYPSLDFCVIYLSSLPPRWILSSNLPDLPSCQVLKATIVG
ncbi:hypothetical protein DFH94DRAFT_678037 [Russula ochroleuca]|uniref:Uncharacterized protein n=1 Tax=Russula ochroleuca TaxID=152965 RepID=A0A9P5TDQ1_9AGAM|nr:hypothetical protein DFH94DRAFT_678037 [Russula ochroleuca]